MILRFSKKAEKDYIKLPLKIKTKADRQFSHLLTNYRHPSLRTRKMVGIDIFEGRIDIQYRFTFQIEGDAIYVLTVGPHDKGLGKK